MPNKKDKEVMTYYVFSKNTNNNPKLYNTFYMQGTMLNTLQIY